MVPAQEDLGLLADLRRLLRADAPSNGQAVIARALQRLERLRNDRAVSDAAALDSMMEARRREEQLRRETETMMMGLRLLLGEQSFREKLEQLAQHLARAIGCDDVRLISSRPGEPPRLVLPDAPGLDETLMLRRILAAADVRAVTLLAPESHEAALVQAALGMRAGGIVLIALPAPGERYTLLCRARHGLAAADQGVAERLSLLLQQALLLKDDQDRIIHAAKLSALGQMSTSIAHELRQPLNTISIAAQNLELLAGMDTIDPIMLREKSDRILGQVERACLVMDRMRRFGRKSLGDHQPVSPAAIARSARSLMDKLTLEGGIAIEIDVDDDLRVMADELEIEQVLVNLIQNAADAIHERAQKGTIRITAETEAGRADMLWLNVEDDGPGFPPDVLTHALDAFFTTKSADKGTGLGLSIAHAIAREHGGRLLIGNVETDNQKEGGQVTGGRVTLVLRRAPESAQLLAFAPRATVGEAQ